MRIDLSPKIVLLQEGNVLAAGDSDGSIQLWDVANTKIIRTMRGHTGTFVESL